MDGISQYIGFFRYTAQAIFLVALLSACQPRESPYPIIDSKVWADSMRNPSIHWLDNERIIFRNAEFADKGTPYQGRFKLSVWDIGKGITDFTEYSKKVVTLCVSEDKIFYTITDETDQTRRYYGKIGHEKLIQRPRSKSAFYNSVSCRWIDDPEISAKRKSRIIKLLLSRHGYLDFGPLVNGNSNEPVTMFLSDGRSIPLEIIRANAETIEYYPFKNAYFIQKNVKFWPGNPDYLETSWWLYPDGEVDEVKIPYGPWDRHVYFYPTVAGMFIVERNFRWPKDPGKSGGYLYQEAKSIKLIDGVIDETKVSPNGCKVAIFHRPYPAANLPGDPGRQTLKMINFCAGGE